MPPMFRANGGSLYQQAAPDRDHLISKPTTNITAVHTGPFRLLGLSYELQEAINSRLPLASQKSLASTCRALRWPQPPFTNQERSTPESREARFDLFCMGERDGKTSGGFACYGCRKVHAPICFKQESHHRDLRNRLCIGMTDLLSLHPGWRMTYTELQQYLKDCDLTSGNVGHLTHQVYSNIRSGDGANHKPFHNVHKPSINSIDSPPQSNSDPSSSTAPSGDDGSETETLIPPLIMWCEGVTLSRPSATFLALSTHYYYPLRAIADFDFCDKLEEALSPKPANLQTRSVTEVARLGFFKEFKNSVAAGLQRKRVDYPLCPHLHLSDILSGLRPPPAGARYSGNGSSSKSCPACHSSCSLLICPTEDAKIQHHKPTDLLVNAQNEEEAVAAVAEGRQIQLTVLPSRPPASPSSPATELPHAGIQLPCIQTTQKIVPKEQLGQYTLVITIRRNLGNLTNAMDPAWLNNLVPPNVIQSSHSKGSSRKEFVARYI